MTPPVSITKTAFLALLVVLWSSSAVAQWVPVAEKKGFGQHLDATSDAVFVGHPAKTYTPGQVFVFTKNQQGAWAQSDVLEADDGTIDDRFGTDVAATNELLAVGAPATNTAYVFEPGLDGSWTQTDRVGPADSTVSFGAQVALAGDRLFVSASVPSDAESTQEVVYVFSETSGDWQKETMLTLDGESSESDFGTPLLAQNDRLYVGTPQHEEGAVTVFRRSATNWTHEQTVTIDSLSDNARLGATLEEVNNQVVVGAPAAHNGTGAAYLLAPPQEGGIVNQRLLPPDGDSGDGFGTALASRSGELWVGAPGAAHETGALFRFRHGDGGWSEGHRLPHPAPKEGTNFGAALATSGSMLVAGLPGDEYGAGTVAVYSTAQDSWTTNSPITPSTTPPFRAITGTEVPCADGTVHQFSCEHVDLKAFLPVSALGGGGGVELSDIWGWTDPKTGREYALVGRADGTAFVDVSDPSTPVYIAELPRTEGSRVNSWRDIKVYADHAFIVADNVGDHGMQVFDLTQLRDVAPDDQPVTFESTAHYDRINSAHNVAINQETGYAYIVGGSAGGRSCGGGLHMVDIQDPRNPTFEGCFGGERGSGSGGTGATHDAQCLVYEGPDQEYQGREICVAYNETEIAVVDVTDKATPELISTASYPNYGYVHQGWFTEDQRYMYSNDEADELQGKVDRTRTIVWDMSDLDTPNVTNQLLLSEPSSDHNLYVKGNRMYQSNYKSGLRVLDISNPEQPEEIGHFDLFPPSSTPGFEGTWSNYPYFESGIVVTSTYDGGLFVLEPSQPEL